MSGLLDWFQKRRETRALKTMRLHLATTISIVDTLEKAVKAAISDRTEGTRVLVNGTSKS